MKIRAKRLHYTILALILCLYVVMPSCSQGDDVIGQIDADLSQTLYNRYKLKIDDSIVFVEGYYDHAFQDSSIYLTLKVPDGSIADFYDNDCYDVDASAEGDIRKRLTYSDELYTYIDFYDSDNGYTMVKFQGRYPGKR